jgi:hypothetical protein
LKRVVRRKDRANRFRSLLPFGPKADEVIKLHEAVYACLPEFEPSHEKPFLLHFKGPRKDKISAYCDREKLV